MEIQLPNTLQDAILLYSEKDEKDSKKTKPTELAFQTMVLVRWNGEGATCPVCGSKEHSFLTTRKVFKCKSCQKQYTVKVGTIMEDSALGLDKWLCAMWMITNAKNGISSYEIHRELGITQKSAWHLLHRIRYAMQTGTFQKMTGEVEADETYVGGLEKNKHMNKRLNAGRGGVGKAIVMGIVERGGVAKAKVIKDTTAETLQYEICQSVEAGSAVHTDSLPSYNGLNATYVHETVNHAIEYVRGNVTTNRIENFFSLLKRSIKGTYICPSPNHLQHYLDEQILRYNTRKNTNKERFLQVLSQIGGKRLTYEALINETMI